MLYMILPTHMSSWHLKALSTLIFPINEGPLGRFKWWLPMVVLSIAVFPAAVAARMQVGHFMTEMVFRALSPGCAGSYNRGLWRDSCANQHFLWSGSRWKPLAYDDHTWGRNGRKQLNGWTPLRNFSCQRSQYSRGNTGKRYPSNRRGTILLPDSGGPGKKRGGLGRKMVICVPDDELSPSLSAYDRSAGRPFSISSRGSF